MDRAALTAYLQREFAEIIAEASIDLGPVLDSVEAVYARVPDLTTVWDELLADYFLLRRAKRAFLTMFDVGVEGDSYRLNQLYQNILKELPNAEAVVAWLVAPTAPAVPDTRRLTLEIPYLEPAWTGDAPW